MARIYGHSYKVERVLSTLGTKRLRNTPFMGVELELEFKNTTPIGSIDIVTDRVIELLGSDFAVCKRDASLKARGEGGIEIVTAPALLPIHQERWGRFFNDVPEELEATARCGMHVHVERAVIPSEVVCKLCWFLYHNGPHGGNFAFVESLAGRRCDEFSQIFELDMSEYLHAIGESWEFDWRVDRYSALNITNTKTIEFRLFASTTNSERFMRRLEFSSALVRWARSLDGEPSDLWERKAFSAWVHSQAKRYPALADWLSERKLFRRHEDEWDENGNENTED